MPVRSPAHEAHSGPGTGPGTAPGGKPEKERSVRARSLLGRLRRTDPLAPLAGLVALVVYLVNGFDGHLSPDLATYAYAGQRFADGIVPYAGVLNRAGPLAHALPGVGAFAAELVNADELTGMRVFFMLFAIAGVVLAYLLSRDLFQSRLAGLGAAGAMLCFRFALEYASSGPREKTPVLALLLAAWWAAHHRRWATAGLVSSLATLTWQPAFVWVGPSVALVILLVEHGVRARVRALVRFTVAGLVPLLLVVAGYLAIGRFSLFYEGFWLINAKYTAPLYAGRGNPSVWEVTSSAYSWSALVGVLGLAVLAVLGGAVLLRRSQRRAAGTATLVSVALAAVLGALWSSYSFDGSSDTMPFLPEAAVGVGALIGALVHRRRVVGLGVGALVIALTVGLAVSYAVPGPIQSIAEQRARDAVVFDRLPPDATLLTADAPEPLVLMDKVNPTRFQRFKNGIFGRLQDVWPGGAAGYVRWIDRSGTTVLALGPGPLRKLAREQGLPHYEAVGPGAEWTWFVNRSVPVETRRSIRQALQALPPRPPLG